MHITYITRVASQIHAFYLWSLPWGQGQTKRCPAPSTSCHLYTCKVWSCYVQRLRRRCNKKIYELDLGDKVTQNVAQFPLHYIWSWYAQRFRGIAFTRKYIIHWPWPLGQDVTQNTAHYPLHHTTYTPTKFEFSTWRCIYKKKHYLTFRLEIKVTRNIAQYPLHHVIYASTKVEVATSNGLEEGTITRNVADGRTDGRTDGQRDDGPALKRN